MKISFIKIFIYINVVICLISCTEKFPLELNQIEPKVVIQAMITDLPGPYYVRLTKTTNSLIVPYYPGQDADNDHAEIIKNGIIIISDNFGNKDTLEPSPSHNFIFKTGGDSLIGYYNTKKIKGIAGRTYYLDVYIEEKHFHSETEMIPVPEIDTVVFSSIVGDPGKSDGIIPLFFLKNINTSFKYGSIIYGGLNQIQNSSLISWRNNRLFEFNQNEPVSFYYFELNGKGYLPQDMLWDTTYFSLATLDNNTFQFYNNCLKQFNSDGGAYKPSPSTPIGNITGGAIGVFQASSIATYKNKPM